MDANSEQIERKKAMQQMEVEEDARIAEYNRQKQLREAAIAEEKDRIAKEKEAECARLRAAQEKVADKQSELDELRARRHAEVVEREWREREAAKAARNKVCMLTVLPWLMHLSKGTRWHFCSSSSSSVLRMDAGMVQVLCVLRRFSIEMFVLT